MRVVNVHNRHANPGGSEVVFEAITRLLRSRGDEVIVVDRDNAALSGLAGKLAAFGSMVYSPSAKREMARLLRAERPDVVHVHNIYPQLSPSILDACREEGVPVAMSVHDYKLTCPTAQHLRDGKPCEKCLGGHEQWCAIHNCRGNRAMSVAYAIRNAAARVSGKVHDGVDAFLCCSNFIANQLIRGGYPAERVRVLPNFADIADSPPRARAGDYVAFVGRVSPEKGIDVLIEAARSRGVPVKIAGDPSRMPELVAGAPSNVEFVGQVSRDRLPAFLAGARMLAVPSVWYEVFGLVCAEAMAQRLPVVASRIGGLPEVVDDGVTGLCVPPGDPDALACAMEELWNDPSRAAVMGEAGRLKALREFSPGAYYERLTAAYRATVATHATIATPAPAAKQMNRVPAKLAG